MNNCPRCDDDLPTVESSREMQISKVWCSVCGFQIAAQVNEDCIIEMWDVIKPGDCAEEN